MIGAIEGLRRGGECYGTARWSTFAAGAFVIAVIPGPGVAGIVGFAFASGRKTALAAVAGMAIGNATAMAASLAGGVVVLASSAVAFTILKWVALPTASASW